VAQFTDRTKVENLIQRFLVTANLETGGGGANAALTLLQQSRTWLRRL
jgi:hypothetical protein